jgi:hemoglobin-like flavoprotein
MFRILIEHKEIKPMWRKRPGVSNENVDYSNPNQAVKNHGEKVFNTIGTVIDSIDDLGKVAPDLNKMGYDHYKYGTRPEHFQVNSSFILVCLFIRLFSIYLQNKIDYRRSSVQYDWRRLAREVQR